ncbi:T9SS type B sorting domain-containing protein [Maribacter polysiphoniae]|uniref:Gliding motility-associated-like protein n=1 Tax=Maribacter polysiphoniae TaxID=429344 RepID=A0A316EFG7_9FLAO|nr:T9SS type B sorting domain-containing protein [Maribacter polysiphoniae]MBD1261975.1 T9SS type B sorting domain-containing protein [Maribacter polysiphoniae]PWK21660.1 gliding motility-associated-like protein [Maribacter polysiphoniae]
MKKSLAFLLLISCFYVSLAQNRANIWYFGYRAGLDFNSGVPVTLLDGQLFTREGCASMCDNYGGLLFYTDGISVYNKNHMLMPNGTGLLGDSSSTHSAIVVPKPDTLSEYYIFTVDDSFGDDGLRYSIVDMSLDGGLGDVTSKNIQLESKIPEKIVAYKITGTDDYWVVSQRYNSNDFLAFRVSGSGVDHVPVISSSGIGNGPKDRPTSQIKISLDGKRLATANGWEVQVFDFDETTGKVSNPITLLPNISSYGVEFSPDGNLLYVSYYSGVCQFNLGAGSETDIENSKVILQSSVEAFGSLQLGPDEKIYGVKVEREYLDVIHNPNELGVACGYQYDDVYLGGRLGFLGLPTFISNIHTLTSDVLYQGECFGDTTEFSLDIQEAATTILWDFGDGNTSSLEAPTHSYATPGTYTLTVTADFSGVPLNETIDLTIYETPIANVAVDEEICHYEDGYSFDLSTKDTEILGGQDPNNFSIDYFGTQQDADNNTNALSTSFDFDIGSTTVYARVSNKQNGQCFETSSFDILIKRTPDLLAVPDSTVCDDDGDGLYTFDLSAWDELIAPAMTNVNVSYHASQTDADTNLNPLPINYTNATATEIIYFRIENTTYPECYQVGNFKLEVIGQVIANQPADLEYCDDNNDGQAVFDLTQVEAEIIGAQNASSINISYHETQIDADANLNALSPTNYISTSYQKTIFVRVSNTSDTSCYDTTSFQLNIFDSPIVPTVSDGLVCDDDNDGQYTFDLSQKSNEILASTIGNSVLFYETQQDAELDQNRIAGTYQNISNPQTVYFRLENTNNPSCFNFGSFELQVYDTPSANRPTDIIVCDVNETGIQVFDLSIKDSEVLNGQDPTLYTVSYFGNQTDAITNENSLTKQSYTNSATQETLYARIQNNAIETCYDTTSFVLIVNPLPQPGLEETYVICPDSPELIIDGGDFDSWTWRDDNNIEIGNERIINIPSIGDFSLTVTRTLNGASCEQTVLFEVLSSGAPDDFTTEITGFSDSTTIQIDAIGVGEFEYSVDGENFQESNRFEVFPGEYTVYVRDKLLCRTLSKEIIAMGYQKFFTPNGDDTNDYWNIIGAANHPGSQLFIYDRYGKLLKQINPLGQGWDGTHNGTQLPSSDYWFRFIYDGGKVFSGHFSLKR